MSLKDTARTVAVLSTLHAAIGDQLGRGFLVGPLLAARLAERLAASLAARPGAS